MVSRVILHTGMGVIPLKQRIGFDFQTNPHICGEAHVGRCSSPGSPCGHATVLEGRLRRHSRPERTVMNFVLEVTGWIVTVVRANGYPALKLVYIPRKVIVDLTLD